MLLVMLVGETYNISLPLNRTDLICHKHQLGHDEETETLQQ